MRAHPLLVLVAACAPAPFVPPDGDDTFPGADDTDPASSDDGGGGDTDLPACSTACWSWTEPAPVPRPSPTPTPAEIVIDGCNASGLEPGVCPDGFTCGPVETHETSAGWTVTQPWCDGGLGLHDLVAEVALGRPAATGVSVPLRLTLNGGPWPGGGAPGEAGQLWLYEPTLLKTVRVDLPTDRSGLVELTLDPGTWRVSFAAGFTVPMDDSRWPRVGRTAALQVLAEPDAPLDVDVRAVEVPVVITLDGARLTTVPAGLTRVDLSWWSATRGSFTRALVPGDDASRPILLQPETWDFTVGLTAADTAPSWPSGTFAALAHHEVRVQDPGVFDLARRTTAVSGDVTVDGATVPSGRADVTWRSTEGSATFRVGGSPAGRYTGRVWDGATYDVSLSSLRDGDPLGPFVAAQGVAPGERDIAARTTSVRGTVTVNGQTPQNGSRGFVVLRQAGAAVRFLVDSFGDAAFDGRMWASGAGPVEAWVLGYGDRVPQGPYRAATSVDLARAIALDVPASRVDLTLTLDGRAPADAASSRGSFFLRATAGSPAPEIGGSDSSVGATASGPLAATALVVPGDYGLAFQARGTSLPVGSVELGTFTARGATTTVRRDVSVATWRITLRDDGANLPPAASGDRGTVYVGSVSGVVPATGPARVELTSWSGEATVFWSCPTATCGVDATIPFQVLWSGLRTQP